MRTLCTLGVSVGVCFLIACSTSPITAVAAPSRLEQSFNDTSFELKSCELKPDRTVTCQMTVSNRYTDKRIEISRNGIVVQDDAGNEYPVTAGGFGDHSVASKWNQVAVADSEYVLHVIAPNISSRATSVRAVVIPRLLVRSMQGTVLGYRDRVVFSGPPMISSELKADAQTTVETAQPAAAPAEIDGEAMPIATDAWQIVGLWNYDAVDGQSIPAHGFELLPKPGAGVGQAWLAQLALKNHEQLTERQRTLWPVMIHVERRKVCADYPGYPSYKVFIDMPGIDEDAIYDVSKCKAE